MENNKKYLEDICTIWSFILLRAIYLSTYTIHIHTSIAKPICKVEKPIIFICTRKCV